MHADFIYSFEIDLQRFLMYYCSHRTVALQEIQVDGLSTQISCWATVLQLVLALVYDICKTAKGDAWFVKFCFKTS